MKPVISLTLILCLAAPAYQASAQERTEPAAQGFVARAIIPEAIRLAVDQSAVRSQFSPNYARTGSSVAKGALIGLGIGAVLGATIGQEACLHSPRWHCAVGMGSLFGAIGAGIAWLR